LLADGTVLVAGGMVNASGQVTGTAEIFNPSTGTWAAAGPMVVPVRQHTATVLSTGKILVAGGNPGPTASAQLYTR
jgi:hypothetical protein